MDSSPACGTTTRTTPYEKSAEFARLYYFFEKLTQPRSCGKNPNQGWTSREAATEDSVPEDIAPLLKNLSAILTKDEPMHGDALEASEALVSIPETPTTALAPTFATTTTTTTTTTSSPPSTHTAPDYHASTTRPRRNTVAGSSTPRSTQPSQAVGQGVRARFPLREKRYPFTFKLLLHKLYDLEGWAAKIQQVLAASQEQFRSLNDVAPVTTGSNPRSPGSLTSGGTTFSGSLFGTPPIILESPTRRQRALSVSRTKANDGARSGLAVARPPQPSRAVKKRIVNRRRSTTGLGVGKKGEWMYDAAVSSVDTENVDARGHDSLRRRKRVLSSMGFAEEERRPVGRDLTNASFYRRERACTVKSQ